MAKSKFPYFYGQDTEQSTFYRVPKQLMTDPLFRELSAEAKLLYAVLLDRMQLSQKNEWLDEDGRVYLYFSTESIAEMINCSSRTVYKLLSELDDSTGIGLVTRIRQGLGKPNKLYVHKCVSPDLQNLHFQTCKNCTSEPAKITRQDLQDLHPNNTDKNNTEKNDTESIDSFYSERTPEPKRTEAKLAAYEEYRDYFSYYLEIDRLKQKRGIDEDVLKEIYELLVDTMCSDRKTIRISGDDKPADVVKGRFMKLNAEHIEFVMDGLSQNTTRVKNIKQYLLAALYNATFTIDSYYKTRVNYDFYGSDMTGIETRP